MGHKQPFGGTAPLRSDGTGLDIDEMHPIFELSVKYPFKKALLNRGYFKVNIRGGVEDTRLEAKAKDSLSEDRHSRGQGEECSRPRPRTKDTSASALQKKKKKRSSEKFFRRSQKKKKKKVFTKIFQAISTKKRFLKNFSSAPQNFNNSKNSAVLEPRTGQFSRTSGLEAKAKDFKICPRGRPRGQGRPRGLHLWLISSEQIQK